MPDAPPVIVIHPSLETAVQLHCADVDTVIVFDPPAATAPLLVGYTVYEHESPYEIVAVKPAAFAPSILIDSAE